MLSTALHPMLFVFMDEWPIKRDSIMRERAQNKKVSGYSPVMFHWLWANNVTMVVLLPHAPNLITKCGSRSGLHLTAQVLQEQSPSEVFAAFTRWGLDV